MKSLRTFTVIILKYPKHVIKVQSSADISQTAWYLIVILRCIAMYVNGPKKQHFEVLKDGVKSNCIYWYMFTAVNARWIQIRLFDWSFKLHVT